MQTNHTISQVMSEIGSRKKTMSIAAINQRRQAAVKRTFVNFKIESGIPIPKRHPGRSQWKQLATTMNYGDSILLSVKQGALLQQAIRFLGDGTQRRSEGSQIRIWKVKRA